MRLLPRRTLPITLRFQSMSTGCIDDRSIKVKSIFLCVDPNKAVTLSPWQSVTQAMFPKDAVYRTCRIRGEFRIDLGRGCSTFLVQQWPTVNSGQQHPALTLQAKWLLSATPRLTVRTFCVQPKQCVYCVLCGSENKQLLLHWTALTDWINERCQLDLHCL